MLFKSSNVNDIEKYYYNTYIKFKEFGDRLFYIQGVTSEKVFGLDENDDYFELLLSDEAPYEVDYILPNKACFSYSDTVYQLQRIPARQYRRGLCDGNTQIVNGNGDKMGLGFKLLSAFVNKPRYVSFGEAFTAKAKVKALALTPRMWFKRNNGGIYVDTIMIGTYSYETKQIFLAKKVFLPEVKKHLAEFNDNYEVLV